MTLELKTLLYEALAQPIGLLLACSDRARFVQKLYQARVKADDPRLGALQFRASPLGEGDLIIVKETVQVIEDQSSDE